MLRASHVLLVWRCMPRRALQRSARDDRPRQCRRVSTNEKGRTMRRHQAPQWAAPQGKRPSAPARHRWEAIGVWGGRVSIGCCGAGCVRWVLARFLWFGTSAAAPW
jgi:hypothetical protein